MKRRQTTVTDASARLLPGVFAGRLGDAQYVYSHPLASFRAIPSQQVDARTHEALEALRTVRAARRPAPAALAVLRQAGYLRPRRDDRRSRHRERTAPTPPEVYVSRPTFFDMPTDVPLGRADVALVGVPLASVAGNHGTIAGLELLRTTSAEVDWFAVHAAGMTIPDSHRPRHRSGRGVTPVDLGNVGTEATRLSDVTAELAGVWRRVRRAGARPVFVGGDHAVTYPILAGLQRAAPRVVSHLTVVHLDAHHDCYQQRGLFNHGTVVETLLNHLRVRRVVSLGLRGPGRPTRKLEALERHRADGRLCQLGPAAARAVLADPVRLEALIGPPGPVYITFDVDVLDRGLVDGAVWTPVRHGLRWIDAFRAIDMVTRGHQVLGADVVEFNPHGRQAMTVARGLVRLIVALIDALGRPGRRFR